MLTRRHFLLSATLLATTRPAFPTASLQGDRPIRTGIIGVGTHGRRLLDLAAITPGVQVVAACDIWTDSSLRWASLTLKGYGQECRTYENYRDFLDQEQDLDAVIVATPDRWHAEHAIACLDRGLHVYCETPMAHTVDAARAMVRKAREKGAHLQIGHQRRSSPRYQHCRNRLLEEIDLLGTIHALNAQWNQPIEQPRGWPPRAELPPETLEKFGFASMRDFRNWEWVPGIGTGPLVQHGVHQMDVAHWFLGALPSRVMASGGTDYYHASDPRWPDTVMAVLEFYTPSGPVRMSYQLLTTNGNMRHYEKLLGEDGTMVMSEHGGLALLYPEPSVTDWSPWVNLDYLAVVDATTAAAPAAGTDEDPVKAPRKSLISITDTVPPKKYAVPVPLEGPYHKPHLENFFAAIRGEAPLNCPPEVGFQALVTTRKIQEAVEKAQIQAFTPEDYSV